jgi:hypothetical protein
MGERSLEHNHLDAMRRREIWLPKSPARRPILNQMSIRPPEYRPPPGRAYTDLGWVCAALTGPATFVAVWIYCAATYGFLIGFFLGWIPAVILALLVAVAMVYLWPLAAIALLYLIYRVFGVYPALPTYIAIIIAIFAIATIWWWHMVRDR